MAILDSILLAAPKHALPAGFGCRSEHRVDRWGPVATVHQRVPTQATHARAFAGELVRD